MFSIRCFTFLNRLKTWKQRPFHVGLTQLLRDIKVKEVLHQDFVEVGWTDGKNSRFPFVYLREKCQCPACYHKPSSQRILHMKNLDLNSRPSATHIKENGTKIEIVWQDEHVSEFESDWLYKKILPKANTSEQSMIREGVKIWDRNLVIPTFGFKPMLKDEHVLLDWLETMRKYGVAKVTGVPKTLGQLERLGNAVGFLKNTLYGESVSLKSEANARSLAYTNKELQPHTDLPYYEFKPSVILLQFIEQVKSDGGANTLVDGFNVVQHFKQQQPRYFDLMVSTAVLWQVIGTEKIYGDFRMMFPRPVIEIGWTGKVARINYNEPLREAFVNVSVDEITDIYHAYSALTKMFYDPQFVVKTKMSAGEMLTMDNDRLLHGRTAYEVHNNDRRWLHQAYIDWDILLSKMNVLKEKLQIADSIDN